MTRTQQSRTSGIDRSLQVLDILAEEQMPMTAYKLSQCAQAPISTIYRIVDELVDRSMLSRTGENKIWLGPRLMRYGLVYRANMDVYSAAQHEMRSLAKRVEEVVQVCVRDEGTMVVVAMSDQNDHFRVTSDVGTRVPLNWTASGRLLVGHLPLEERREMFRKHALPSNTGTAETDPQVLAEQSGRDFEQRLALQVGQSEYAVACLAVPIRDISGACVATLSIVMSEQKLRTRQETLTEELWRSADAVEEAIGRSV
ncbi:IclR family transcriptional regulator [Devosia sp. PTR5]|uniref:IclR family transcriptional regulator n=1 Tax=Devosia oryzisoli TaxID=2774138 RepID=A0A927FUZ4_9HYPH|nr:IclR family transcriptional regulator [Devosia oryzisoli]MBD8065992.1 IclR family transcriptional regulator [Devosia oryzisoli]